MGDNLEEIRKQMLLKIPEGATPEQFHEIMAKKMAGVESLQQKVKKDQASFDTLMRWLDLANYVWMSVLAALMIFIIVRTLQQSRPSAFHLLSGSTGVAVLLLLSGVYALRGRLRR